MRKFKFLFLLSVFFCVFVKHEICEAAKLHAYALRDVSVLDSESKPIATIKKGTVFRYRKERNGYVRLQYEGNVRYALSANLVLDSGLKRFIKQNRELFDTKLRTLSKLSVYKDRSKKKVLCKVSKKTEFYSFGEYGQFYKVQVDGEFGYVEQKLCQKFCMLEVTEFPKVQGNTPGEKIADFAKKFVGNPYVWGGVSLTAGCDCSGFVQSVYRKFGYNLPRCSYQQAEEGKKVSFKNLQPGDLIFYYRGSRIGHVTMYVGDGNVVQARGSAYGIVITRYDYSVPAFAKRIIG